mgnify:FL=1
MRYHVFMHKAYKTHNTHMNSAATRTHTCVASNV